MEAYFQGKKELFQGLAMEKLEKDWTKYPILHIDLNTQKYDSPQSLESKLNRTLVTWEKLYGNEPAEDSLSMRFEGTIQRAYEQTGQRVVILVDEYDKPMLQVIGNEALQKQFTLHIILSACTIRLVCSMLLSIENLAAIGLKRAHRPIW